MIDCTPVVCGFCYTTQLVMRMGDYLGRIWCAQVRPLLADSLLGVLAEDKVVLPDCLWKCQSLSHVLLYATPVLGILQARRLEWIAIFSSRGPSPPGDYMRVSCSSCIGQWTLYCWATGEALTYRRIPVILWAELSAGILQARREWPYILKY